MKVNLLDQIYRKKYGIIVYIITDPDEPFQSYFCFFLLSLLQADNSRCNTHRQDKDWYCEDVGCRIPICSHCGCSDHQGHRLKPLNVVADDLRENINKLLADAEKRKPVFEDVIKTNNSIIDQLEKSTEKELKKIDRVREDLMNELDYAVRQLKGRLNDGKKDKLRKIQIYEGNLENLAAVSREGLEVVESKSDYVIASRYLALEKALTEANNLGITEADKALGNLTLHELSKPKNEAGTSTISQLLCSRLGIRDDPSTSGASWFRFIFKKGGDLQDQRPHGNQIEHAARKLNAPKLKTTWIESKIVHRTRCPVGIAINQDNGDLAVTRKFHGVTILSRNDISRTFDINGSHTASLDIAFSTETNEYILLGDLKFSRHNGQGDHIQIKHFNACPDSVAVNSAGKIVLGFGRNKSIRVYDKYGNMSGGFETTNTPCKLTSTRVNGNDKLVISFVDGENEKKLQIMNEDGNNEETIDLPQGVNVKEWKPAYVCCNHDGKLFVGNLSNRKVFVYEFIDGKYECNSSVDLNYEPWGLAWFEKENALFVVAHNTDEIFSYSNK